MINEKQKKTRILIVEDDNRVAQNIQQGLVRLGYEVSAVVNNGTDTIRAVEKAPPDLILTAIRIQGDLDGIDTIKEIRKSFDIPVIFLTAYSDEATLQRAKQVEPFGYLLKPFEEPKLRTAIEVVIQKHKVLQKQLTTSRVTQEKSEKALKAFIESIEDYAIFTLNSQGNITSWNTGAERIKGYRAEEILGKPFTQLYPQGTLETETLNKELEITASLGRFEQESWHVRKDGTKFWANLLITALRDKQGNLLGYGEVLKDLTTKKQALDALAESEAKKTTILNTSLDSIISMDHEGNIAEFNPAAEALFGYRRIDVLGKDMSELIMPPDLRTAHKKGLSLYLNTGHGPLLGKRVEIIALKSDGTEFPVEVAIIVNHFDGRPFFTGFLRDISEVKKRERERAEFLETDHLAKQRQAIQYNVMSLIASANSMKDAGAKIIRLITQSLKWDIGALWVIHEETQTIQLTDSWHSPKINTTEFIQASQKLNLKIGQGWLGKIWQTSKAQWIEDIIFDPRVSRFDTFNKGGLHSALGFPIVSGETVLGVMEFYSCDINPPDDNLLQMIATLGGQIGQFMKRLITEERLHKALGQRDEFISIASHELKTPITTLSLHLQMLHRSLKTQTDISAEKIKKSINECNIQVKKLSVLLDELLDLTRIHSGKLQLEEKKEVNLPELTQELVERIANNQKLSHLISMKVCSEEIKGHWDAIRIEQIITNLLINAIKYGDGKPIEIEISSDPLNEQAIFKITDHGLGIALPMQSKIFERFERAVGPTHITGLGLGLYITRKIVEAHGGSISVQSEINQGSTFTVILPLKVKKVAA